MKKLVYVRRQFNISHEDWVQRRGFFFKVKQLKKTHRDETNHFG